MFHASFRSILILIYHLKLIQSNYRLQFQVDRLKFLRVLQ